MPFREKMKKAFSSKGRHPSGSSQMQSQSQSQEQQQQQPPSNDLVLKRTRSQKANLYRIGEPMPPTKYPGKYDKPHQEMLRAFSWATAFGRRRSSQQTDVSPMGSRWASRKNSVVSGGGRKSTGHRPSNVAHLVENAADPDDDVANVGLSRQVTAERHVDDHHSVDLEELLVTAPSTPIRSPTPNGVAHHHPQQELSSTLQKSAVPLSAH
ncbi:MAG: hypothetical protein M1816_002877 [Peltula sp. TS41687]|nr:MAG: hypothetical protein M1816_002877 [Peltula sp. TS41687]